MFYTQLRSLQKIETKSSFCFNFLYIHIHIHVHILLNWQNDVLFRTSRSGGLTTWLNQLIFRHPLTQATSVLAQFVQQPLSTLQLFWHSTLSSKHLQRHGLPINDDGQLSLDKAHNPTKMTMRITLIFLKETAAFRLLSISKGVKEQ